MASARPSGRRVLPGPLVVSMPGTHRTERGYVLGVLLADWLGLDHIVDPEPAVGETIIRPGVGPTRTAIVIPDVLLDGSHALPDGERVPDVPLRVVDAVGPDGGTERMPILFPSGPADGPLMRREGDRLVLAFDLLGALFFLLTRYEEYGAADRLDEKGRFPARASVLSDGGWLRWPIADMYTLWIAAVMRDMWPGLRPDPSPGSVVVSHDVDHPSATHRWRGMAIPRVLVADVLRRRDVGLALRRAAAFVPSARLAGFDPYATFAMLMSVSESLGLRSTFFFLTLDSHLPAGSRYTLSEDWARRLIEDIADRGHHLGLHASYVSSSDGARLREEWRILEQAAAELPAGTLRRAVRQHHLMMQAGKTWRAQAEAGLEVDESLGFADDIGYRAGTARSFQAFDLASGAALPLRVRPLHVMDVTMREYLGLDTTAAHGAVMDLAHRTRRYGGELSLLWHNSSLEGASARRAYADLMADVAV